MVHIKISAWHRTYDNMKCGAFSLEANQRMGVRTSSDANHGHDWTFVAGQWLARVAACEVFAARRQERKDPVEFIRESNVFRKRADPEKVLPFRVGVSEDGKYFVKPNSVKQNTAASVPSKTEDLGNILRLDFRLR